MTTTPHQSVPDFARGELSPNQCALAAPADLAGPAGMPRGVPGRNEMTLPAESE
jgi:hypothetical protein